MEGPMARIDPAFIAFMMLAAFVAAYVVPLHP